ncbi:Zn-ribbon domain-containing OB-fold protein [Blastococcus capsensis]|uniref:Zn-ribbon domain-containing OB-fold protein n=1 Tax=Blastococcus capsensis TaxID=1564163 RepID=UPI002540CAAD|nr:OB-fold domain-containing protein [Blastococcus capsensis]MDK3257779.1 OB-fold domain-containing protein [Blastococcus capsensis]
MSHPGTGRIVSFTEVFRTTYAAFESELPYWIVMVELAPGAVLVSNLVRADGSVGDREPRIGDAVQLTYRERGGATVPVFEWAEQAVVR